MRFISVPLVAFAQWGFSRSFAPLATDHPGTLGGRALTLGLDGSWVPAVGAQAAILSTSLSAVADADRSFLLSGIAQPGGKLLVALSSDGTGTLDEQVLISLADLDASCSAEFGNTCCLDIGSLGVHHPACTSSRDCCSDLVCDDGGFGNPGACCIGNGSGLTCYDNADCCSGTCYANTLCDPPAASCFGLGQNCGVDSCCYAGACDPTSHVCCVPMPTPNTGSAGITCVSNANYCSGLQCNGSGNCFIPETAGIGPVCRANSDCCEPKVCHADLHCHYIDGGI